MSDVTGGAPAAQTLPEASADDAATFADSVFEAARHRVLGRCPDDEPGLMLRSPGLKTGGKFYAFATAADLVVKLPKPRVDELVESGTGLACSPRPGRPMKEWVRIPAPDEEACVAYLLESRAFVAASRTGGVLAAAADLDRVE